MLDANALPSDEHARRLASDYAGAWADLLPQGAAWPRDPNTVLYTTLQGLAGIWGAAPAGAPPTSAVPAISVDGRAADLLEIESDPRQTVQLLPDWERSFGLPDLCLTEPQTISDRQTALVARIAMLGGQSRPWFIDYAAFIGYTISINEHSPFMCGVSQCGDTRGILGASPGQYRWEIGPPTIRFTWSVVVSTVRLTWFRCGGGGGQCGVDTLLEIALATDLECAFRRYKPAHTSVVFDYSEVSTFTVTWTYLLTLYPSLTQNGSVIMASDGSPDSLPAAAGIPWVNGGVLMLSSLLTSADTPEWVEMIPTSPPSSSGDVWINGLVLQVS
jgi:uncharacterized protein YmfQ (DUF2313 family)